MSSGKNAPELEHGATTLLCTVSKEGVGRKAGRERQRKEHLAKTPFHSNTILYSCLESDSAHLHRGGGATPSGLNKERWRQPDRPKPSERRKDREGEIRLGLFLDMGLVVIMFFVLANLSRDF